MKIMINLDIGQYVRIRYNIICYSTVNSYLVTRVKIDGVENRFFLCMAQNTIYHHNAGDKEVYLEKGTHPITLEYRGDAQIINNYQRDWTCAIFSVEHRKINQ